MKKFMFKTGKWVKNFLVGSVKYFFLPIFRLFIWLLPFSFFVSILYIPSKLWDLNFEKYLDLLGVLIWPFTLLVVLFFFKKVFTYLFFSIEGFNFFGLKGKLRDVNEVISEEVDTRILDEKKERKRKKKVEELNEKIKTKEKELNKSQGISTEQSKLIDEVFKGWRESNAENEKVVNKLNLENKKLKRIISDISNSKTGVNCLEEVDENETSDSVSVEDSNKK